MPTAHYQNPLLHSGVQAASPLGASLSPFSASRQELFQELYALTTAKESLEAENAALTTAYEDLRAYVVEVALKDALKDEYECGCERQN